MADYYREQIRDKLKALLGAMSTGGGYKLNYAEIIVGFQPSWEMLGTSAKPTICLGVAVRETATPTESTLRRIYREVVYRCSVGWRCEATEDAYEVWCKVLGDVQVAIEGDRSLAFADGGVYDAYMGENELPFAGADPNITGGVAHGWFDLHVTYARPAGDP